jgi:hypothetical protein
MLLQTLIPARRDGTVLLEYPDGRAYTFVVNAETGQLECLIDDEALVRELLRTDQFAPAREADYDEAARLTEATDEADAWLDEGDESAPPIERAEEAAAVEPAKRPRGRPRRNP